MRQYTATEKTALLALTKSGVAVKAAANQLDVGLSTAYGWAKRGNAPMAVSRATRRGPNTFVKFVQLTRASTHTPLVKLRVGGAELSVEPGFDACLLQAVVAALRGTP